jgi:probable rRNA maturation factor
MPEVPADGVSVTGTCGLPASAVARAVRHVVAAEQQRATIAVTFLGPKRMRALNAQYLAHDYVTDVISFGLPQPDGSIAGDLYICRYAAARQARGMGVSVREELLRLLVHGTLHVLGWDHPGDASRTHSPMWRLQERYLRQVA